MRSQQKEQFPFPKCLNTLQTIRVGTSMYIYIDSRNVTANSLLNESFLINLLC